MTDSQDAPLMILFAIWLAGVLCGVALASCVIFGN